MPAICTHAFQFNTYLLSTYYDPGSGLGMGGNARTKEVKVPALQEWERATETVIRHRGRAPAEEQGGHPPVQKAGDVMAATSDPAVGRGWGVSMRIFGFSALCYVNWTPQ